MTRKRTIAFTALLVVLAAVVGAASALVAQSAWNARDQSRAARAVSDPTPTATVQPTPFLINRPSYNDALVKCGYKGPEAKDGPVSRCMMTKYNYVYSGTKLAAAAVQTAEASGANGLADRVEALQAEVVNLEVELHNQTQELAAQQSSVTDSDSQLTKLDDEVAALKAKQQDICSTMRSMSTKWLFIICD